MRSEMEDEERASITREEAAAEGGRSLRPAGIRPRCCCSFSRAQRRLCSAGVARSRRRTTRAQGIRSTPVVDSWWGLFPGPGRGATSGLAGCKPDGAERNFSATGRYIVHFDLRTPIPSSARTSIVTLQFLFKEAK